MPVFFVAIGSRLGYPLKLVRAQGHLFARWDEGDKSFNVEGTSLGFVSDPDSFYRTWPHAFTDEEAEAESYLKPLTPVQELATFLSIRGACCRAATNWLWALGAFQYAFKLEPRSVGHQYLFAVTERDAFAAGALPKRAALQYAIRSLEIPPGPMQPEFVMRKASLNAMNLAEADVREIERGLELLRMEVNAFKSPAFCPIQALYKLGPGECKHRQDESLGISDRPEDGLGRPAHRLLLCFCLLQSACRKVD